MRLLLATILALLGLAAPAAAASINDNTIGTATNGEIASYYQEKGFQYPIIVQFPEANRKTVQEMQNIPIRMAGRTGPMRWARSSPGATGSGVRCSGWERPTR